MKYPVMSDPAIAPLARNPHAPASVRSRFSLPRQGMKQEGGEPLRSLLQREGFDQGHRFPETIGDDPDNVQEQAL